MEKRGKGRRERYRRRGCRGGGYRREEWKGSRKGRRRSYTVEGGKAVRSRKGRRKIYG
jgi:hypothetical protein